MPYSQHLHIKHQSISIWQLLVTVSCSSNSHPNLGNYIAILTKIVSNILLQHTVTLTVYTIFLLVWIMKIPRTYHNSGMIKLLFGSIITVSLFAHILPKLNPDMIKKPTKHSGNVNLDEVKPYNPIWKKWAMVWL